MMQFVDLRTTPIGKKPKSSIGVNLQCLNRPSMKAAVLINGSQKCDPNISNQLAHLGQVTGVRVRYVPEHYSILPPLRRASKWATSLDVASVCKCDAEAGLRLNTKRAGASIHRRGPGWTLRRGEAIQYFGERLRQAAHEVAWLQAQPCRECA